MGALRTAASCEVHGLLFFATEGILSWLAPLLTVPLQLLLPGLLPRHIANNTAGGTACGLG
eukprot:3871406-Prorocentrum_lima.AAC.1